MASTRNNWLVRWKQHFDSLSSDLMRVKYFNRSVVDYTHTMLLQFWGSDFFDFDFVELMQRGELHFIQSLVFRPKPASFYKLVETCFLLDYAYSESPDQYRRIESFKLKSESVKDTLCELLLEYAFREAGIDYTASPQRGGQILEGYCTIDGEKALVECKNKYSINNKEFRVICYLTARLMTIGQKLAQIAQSPNLGVGYVFFINPVITENQTYNVISQLEEYLLANKALNMEGTFEDANIRVELKPGSAENYEEFEQRKVTANMFFSTKHTYQFDANDNLQFDMNVGHKSSAKRDSLSKRLIKTLKDARAQHKDDPSDFRIFCIVNEFLNDFKPPLLVNSAEFVPDISRYLSSKSTNDIVILLDRRFNLDRPFIQPHIMGADHLNKYKRRLGMVEFSVLRRIAAMGL